MRFLRRTTPLQRYAALVIAVVIAVVLYLFVSGAFERSDDPLQAGSTPVSTEPVAEPDAPEASRDGPVRLGEAGRAGAVDYVVDEVSYPVAVPGGSAVERFGRVRLRAINRGSSPVRFDAGTIRIVASDGRSFAPDEELSASASVVLDGALAPPTMLQPGLATTLIVVFQLPNDAGGLTLRLHGAWVDFALRDDE